MNLKIKPFFPPVLFLESKSLHEKESNDRIDDSHQCPDDDITRIMHPIVYSRESHEKYKDYPKRKKFFLKINNNHDEERRECHMTRWKGRIIEGMTDCEEISMERPGSWTKNTDFRKKHFIYSFIDEIAHDR